MTEKRSLEEEIKIKAQESRKVARYMSSTQDLVEEQIRKAAERGEFDHLSGAGKPVDLEENPFVPPELRMMFKILKDNDYAPYWIELGKEIDQELEKFFREVEEFRQVARKYVGAKRFRMPAGRFQKKKELFYFEKRRELEKISRKILDYNLQCPTFRLGRSNLTIEEEMQKVIRSVEEILEEDPRQE